VSSDFGGTGGLTGAFDLSKVIVAGVGGRWLGTTQNVTTLIASKTSGNTQVGAFGRSFLSVGAASSSWLVMNG